MAPLRRLRPETVLSLLGGREPDRPSSAQLPQPPRTPVTSHPRHDRTARLLELRLEVLADRTERSLSGPRSVARDILAVEAATRHAVALEVLSQEEAGEIWAKVAERHPNVPWCQSGCPGLFA